MPATVTLSTTTLVTALDATSNEVKLASTSGLTPGKRLFVNGEVMTVVRLLIDSWVQVSRGVDGTKGSIHPSGLTVFIADAHQLYDRDPVGAPPVAIHVSPWINVRNGSVWFARGDVLPEGNSNRWWQQRTTTYGVGPLGVLTTTFDPTVST